MPTKCIAQMPTPMAKPPPTSQAQAATPAASRMRIASVSAVYDASMATSSESRTKPWW